MQSEHHDGGDTINCNSLPWLPLAPNVWVRIVKMDAETGSYTIMVRAEPGGVLPRHRHLANAAIYIIKGNGAHPQTGAFKQGDFVTERDGATHEPLHFHEECELLMISDGPSAFLDDADRTLFLMDVPMLQGLQAAASA
ncbi:hypothetical protein ASPZODRAFT_150787 [Penicilliopsis zonata CBS 506.65]|uniref:ChrR-like cupin domain-containing protein n=1 Tax=Penicilliopsis zonata CBS 506.65 TaxID=1073090 RepID=A0A1L9SNB2_9EURO|nr:hypothetical protein ASPZODRAFT_150787 [Penicilliopsis zonata CBS 506.65]OJJ48591.1 hypothetical protein ASPZODRAFT_150787 [Penicilliopsis zonata CBS 506.65]